MRHHSDFRYPRGACNQQPRPGEASVPSRSIDDLWRASQRRGPQSRNFGLGSARARRVSLSALPLRPRSSCGRTVRATDRTCPRHAGPADAGRRAPAQRAAFLRAHDPAREGGWIAERDGVPVGSVFVVRQDARTAKLRLLLVEPGARGLGIGRRLVEHAMGFARGAGYARMTLWTNDVLVAARRIYETAGFVCTAREPHRSFGKDLVAETWERDLGEGP
jgi:GNAT superfamily N-acetyltransferase